MSDERKYLQAITDSVRKCRNYQPKLMLSDKLAFGPCTYRDFQSIFKIDPIIRLCGLDCERLYIAHRLNGAIDQIYRRFRIGCAKMIRMIFRDCGQSQTITGCGWRFKVRTRNGNGRTLNMDACVRLNEIRSKPFRDRVHDWIDDYCRVHEDVVAPQSGLTFKLTLGYKLETCKDFYIDLDLAGVSWSQGFMPVLMVLSSQDHGEDYWKYENSRWNVMSAGLHEDTHRSLFSFFRNVAHFDLAGFFESYGPSIQATINDTLDYLLDINELSTQSVEQTPSIMLPTTPKPSDRQGTSRMI